MSEPRIRATTRAIVTIELHEAGGAWGQDCTIGQVYSQSRDAAINAIRNRLSSVGVRIIGEPKITTIIVPEES